MAVEEPGPEEESQGWTAKYPQVKPLPGVIAGQCGGLRAWARDNQRSSGRNHNLV